MAGPIPAPRPSWSAMPCGTCPKIPADAPIKSRFNRVELDERGWEAWRFYKECKAVNDFPKDDAMVRECAVEIAAAYESVERHRQREDLYMAVRLAGGELSSCLKK